MSPVPAYISVLWEPYPMTVNQKTFSGNQSMPRPTPNLPPDPNPLPSCRGILLSWSFPSVYLPFTPRSPWAFLSTALPVGMILPLILDKNP